VSQHVGPPPEDFPLGIRSRSRGDRRGPFLRALRVQRQEQVGLARERGVDGALGESRLQGDHVHRGGVKALAQEDPARGIQQLAAREVLRLGAAEGTPPAW
jgi:hypothetical protein